MCRKGKHSTRMAGPFRAAGIPTQRSHFKHPDVELLLTHLSHLQCGFEPEDLKECIITLFGLAVSKQKTLYR